MNQNSANPAIAHMDAAQDEMATYALLIRRAQSFLNSSMQAFERANEHSRAGDCPTSQQITQQLREQYAALTNLTDAIVETLAAPALSRMMNTAPKQSPGLVVLLELLPEEERELIIVGLRDLLQGESEKIFLTEEQVELTVSILYAIGKEYVPTPYRETRSRQQHYQETALALMKTRETTMDNDYDQFEAEMLQAGWSLDKIESAWQKALREEENISSSSAICHDDYDPSWEED